jgi:hypothetical protein
MALRAKITFECFHFDGKQTFAAVQKYLDERTLA